MPLSALEPEEGAPTPLAVIEDGYRAHFGLSWQQLHDEPADAIWEWVTLQNCREVAKRLHRHTEVHA